MSEHLKTRTRWREKESQARNKVPGRCGGRSRRPGQVWSREEERAHGTVRTRVNKVRSREERAPVAKISEWQAPKMG